MITKRPNAFGFAICAFGALLLLDDSGWQAIRDVALMVSGLFVAFAYDPYDGGEPSPYMVVATAVIVLCLFSLSSTPIYVDSEGADAMACGIGRC